METRLQIRPILEREARSAMCLNGYAFPLLVAMFFAGLDATAQFPFTIVGDRFYRDGAPTFLAGIGYQPLEPGQAIDAAIRLGRIEDDLKRLEDYGGGSDTLVLRVYAQPTSSIPNRMPSEFYDGVRTLDFWIIRDIFFYDFKDGSGFEAIARGQDAIDSVFEEVRSQGALDRILAWEIGNEFGCNFETGQGLCNPDEALINTLELFIESMAAYIKTKAAKPEYQEVSDWVTWGSFPPNDPLLTDGSPVLPDGLDFISFNAYSYEPERLREHQGGAVTGTPFGGYLTALSEAFPGKPLVLSETGLADSLDVPPDSMHLVYRPYSPQYRKGDLSSEAVAEGLAERYWDARLGGVAGMLVFEWNDEWHKEEDPFNQSSTPEESFGLLKFDSPPPEPPIARNKIQQEVIRDLFSLDFDQSADVVSGISAVATSLVPGATTTVHAAVGSYPLNSLRYVWYASRGHIIGASDSPTYQAPPRALGSAQISLVAIAPDHKAAMFSTTIAITPPAGPEIDIRTFGLSRATGYVSNIDLATQKLVVWVETDKLYPQPFVSMKSIWVGPDGYWWTHINNDGTGTLHVWLAPKSYVQPDCHDGPPPGEILLVETMTVTSDLDSDHLDDAWEISHFGSETVANRFDDSDMDGARNDEEFLRGTDPTVSDNDADSDGLDDTWELRFFGSLIYSGTADPDGDGINNATEQALWLHPSRASVDADGDALPDTWEVRANGSTSPGQLDPFGAGFTNAEAYSLGFPSATIWVEFGFSGNHIGTPSEPMPTLRDAVEVTRQSGTVHVKAGASQETITISRPVRIVAEGGTVRIGSL